MSVSITEYKPAVALQRYVEFYWEGQFNTIHQPLLNLHVAPNGFAELIIHLTDIHCDLPVTDGWSQSPDYTIIGLYTMPYEVQFRQLVKVFGIRFKPEGIYNLFGIPASVFSENYEDMELILGKEFREYCWKIRESTETNQKIALSNSYLFKQLEKHHPESTYLNRAAELIRNSDGIEKIDDLPDKVYISLRQLEREFKQKIGVSPKKYLRIARLNNVNRMLEKNGHIEFTKIAHDCGYADQAHFIRDFKSMMGVNPTIFIKERHQYLVKIQSADSVEGNECA
jgi:AraC-like DNA-binding protein